MKNGEICGRFFYLFPIFAGRTSPFAMYLKRISILNYKNLEQVELQFSPKLNCLWGLNGMGKTNLLDAIHYLSFCKSAGNPIDSQNVRHGADFFVIQGWYEDVDGAPEEVLCSLKRGQRKHVKRSGKEYTRLSDHIGLLPLVMVAPADLDLISGGGEERRRLMDTVIAQQDKVYLEALIRYSKALTQRNALLKQEGAIDEGLMDVWEAMMAQTGEVIYRRRQAFVRQFVPIFQALYTLIAPDGEEVGLTYETHASDSTSLLEVIRASRERDRIVGHSLRGVHRDDLQMLLGGYPIRREGSQGQNKTYVIALRLAQYDFLRRTGRTAPLLLLDDVFDRLDASRVEAVVRLVASDRFGQIFISDTGRERLAPILRAVGGPRRTFAVCQGTAREESAGGLPPEGEHPVDD